MNKRKLYENHLGTKKSLRKGMLGILTSARFLLLPSNNITSRCQQLSLINWLIGDNGILKSHCYHTTATQFTQKHTTNCDALADNPRTTLKTTAYCRHVVGGSHVPLYNNSVHMLIFTYSFFRQFVGLHTVLCVLCAMKQIQLVLLNTYRILF